jgi:hypothetical protein
MKNLAVLISLIVLISACTSIQYQPTEGQTTLVCPDGRVISCDDAETIVVEEDLTIEIEEEGDDEFFVIEEDMEDDGEMSEEETEDEQRSRARRLRRRYITKTEVEIREILVSENIKEEIIDEVMAEELTEEDMEEDMPEDELMEEEDSQMVEADVVAVEGDLIELDTEVSDPDGDVVTLTYSEPFDEEGKWQTEEGDAGTYTVTVLASDGKVEIEKEMIVLVKPANMAPTIEIEDVTVFEGEKVVLNPVVNDDGDFVDVSFSGWMETNEKETGFDDAGEYEVVITASDGISTTTKTVIVTVVNFNREPELEITNMEKGKLIVTEGDEVEIVVVVSDPDGDDVEVSFSEPFDEEGKWIAAVEEDKNEYIVSVTADDGVDLVATEVLVIVRPKNQAPVFEEMDPIDVLIPVGKSKTIVLEPEVEDPEGEEVELEFSGWMESAEKVVAWGEEGGEHTVTVTATDESGASSSIDVTINVNSEPCFIGDCPQ